jgi:hypothetical protein
VSREPEDRKTWLDEPRNVNRVFYGLVLVCVLLLAVDLLSFVGAEDGHPLYDKHPHFTWEGWFGFYGLFGFVAFVAAVFAGKFLRLLLKRDEDFYER